MNISMEFIPFCPDVMKMRILSIFKIKFQRKRRKQPKNEIRPANCKIDGLAKLFVRGAVKNLNPRKTETPLTHKSYMKSYLVKNLNPRKTETTGLCPGPRFATR